MLPQAGLFKTKMLRTVQFLAQLPFSNNAGAVPGVLHDVSESGLIPVQKTESYVVAHVIYAGHQFYPTGGAERIGKCVGESHACGGQLIQVGCLILVRTVDSQAFIAQIVGHDQHDIGFFSLRGEVQ